MIRRRASLVSMLILWVVAPISAYGETSEEAQRMRAYQAAIAQCVATVRNESVLSKFDMYLTKPGELRGWGTDHEVYLFNKCMEQRGYDTQVETPPKGGGR